MWFGEFQINANQSAGELIGLLQNRNLGLEIFGQFKLANSERSYLQTHAFSLIEELYWKKNDPGRTRGGQPRPSLVDSQQIHKIQLKELKANLLPQVEALLKDELLDARLLISTDGGIEATPNPLLGLLFATYMPQKVGVIDYHGPNRTYNRTKLDSVNLRIESTENQQRQHALYNSANKYANLKVEMTSAYVRHLIAEKADPNIPETDQLTTTLKELFSTFFPGKEFLGPQPTTDGRLTFMVRLGNGATHDIDELSSGEKEVVYGYLRLHSSAPLNSMVMIDEPELHLNPRLVAGLAAFYYRHLAANFGNQLWLVTHSDTLIREAVNHPSFDVFHIQSPEGSNDSQATPVKAKGELENVVLALVGDLAAYRPGQKVVIFESTEDASFDMQMTCKLFPEFEQQINAISAGNKKRVHDLYELLEAARVGGQIDTRFFAIADPDSDAPPSAENSTRFLWDVYHIENYLLDPSFLLKAFHMLGAGQGLKTHKDVIDELKKCALDKINELVTHKLSDIVNRELVSVLKLKFDPKRIDTSVALNDAIQRSRSLIDRKIDSELTSEWLLEQQQVLENSYHQALNDGTWFSLFPGRDLLKRFTGLHGRGVPYARLRDHLINSMAEAQYQPLGMGRVIHKIMAA
ncbi:hypothetical protein E5CHR_04941 [Variovorax sp. PBL-E5]|nr:hypothetical protein E5CHR_04941 [Variovorax sp. PBL-E5]